jgi:hypothetical protein
MVLISHEMISGNVYPFVVALINDNWKFGLCIEIKGTDYKDMQDLVV